MAERTTQLEARRVANKGNMFPMGRTWLKGIYYEFPTETDVDARFRLQGPYASVYETEKTTIISLFSFGQLVQQFSMGVQLSMLVWV